MAKYTVFESVNMGSTHYAERIFDAVASTDIENGTIGYLNGLSDKDGVIYNFVAGTKEGLGAGDIVVVDNPAWDEDTSKRTNQRRDKYIIPAGMPFRVRTIKKNDEFGITIEGFTAASKSVVTNVTDFKTNNVSVSIDATTGKLVAKAGNSTGIMVGKVMRTRTEGDTIVTSLRSYGYSTVFYEIKVTGFNVG